MSNIVSVVPTPDGKGYWLIGSDGGVFAFGDATSQGSLPGLGVGVSDIVGGAHGVAHAHGGPPMRGQIQAARSEGFEPPTF